MRRYLRNVWKVMPVFLFGVMLASIGYAKSAQDTNVGMSAETKMKAAAELMISAEHMIKSSLEKQGLTEDPSIVKGNAMLTNGEKMILVGKEMMQHANTRIQGKDKMMLGSSKMMEGKDFIVKELKKKGLLKTVPLKKDEQMLVDGENLMLEGKNLMMNGLRDFV